MNLFGKSTDCKIEPLPVNPRTGRVCYKMTCVKIPSRFDPAARAHQQSMTRLAQLKAAIAQVTPHACSLQCFFLLIACSSVHYSGLMDAEASQAFNSGILFCCSVALHQYRGQRHHLSGYECVSSHASTACFMCLHSKPSFACVKAPVHTILSSLSRGAPCTWLLKHATMIAASVSKAVKHHNQHKKVAVICR